MSLMVFSEVADSHHTQNLMWQMDINDRTRRALTDHSIVSYQCTTDIRTHTEPYGT